MGVNGIYGLSGSGLDVESMVKVGMMSKQKELDKMQQKYTQNEWKKAEYLDLYSEVQTFNNSTLSQYKLSSNMNSRAATSNNEAAVTVSANANAAPMQHYVEVGQLASAAYLVGTEPIARMNTSATSSAELKNILFASLTKNDTDGKYEYTVTGTDTPTTGLDASDVAFTFKIGDGSTGKDYVNSSNENIFSAEVVGDDGNVLSTISSHTVLLESYQTSPEKITSLSLEGISGGLTSTTSMKEVFRNIFGLSEEEYNARFQRMASTSSIRGQTAFTLKFDDGNTDNTAISVNFTYADLMRTATNGTATTTSTNTTAGGSFYAKIKAAVDNSSNDTSNISVNIVDKKLVFTNAKTGENAKINISIDTGTGNSNTFIGQKSNSNDYRLSMFPEIISGSNTSLFSTTTTKASEVFKTLLAIDGDTDTAAQYIKNYSDSNDIALSIQFSDTQTNGTVTTGTVDITFNQLASTDTFLNVLKSTFSEAGLTNIANNITFDTNNKTLVIGHVKNGTTTSTTDATTTNTALRGSDSSIAFNIRNVGVGDDDHLYPTASPENTFIQNQDVRTWFANLTGIATDTFITRYRELLGTASAANNENNFKNSTALTLELDDGINTTPAKLQISYSQLYSALTSTSTVTTSSRWLGNLLNSATKSGTTNIEISTNASRIKISNDTLGSESKISIVAKLDDDIVQSNGTLETNGKINLNNANSTTKVKDFFSNVTSGFTDGDKATWTNDTAVAFKLQFKDSDNSPTASSAIEIYYSDLASTATTTLYTKLHNQLGGNYNVRSENGNLVVYNTETGANSHIEAVISNVSMGTGNLQTGTHLSGTAATASFTIHSEVVTAALFSKGITITGNDRNYVSQTNVNNTAISVTFNDGSNTIETVTVTWDEVFSGDFSKIKTTHGNIKWQNNQFENDRINEKCKIEINTSTGDSTTVTYNTTTTATNVSSSITIQQVTPTQTNGNSIYTYEINGTTYTATNSNTVYYYLDQSNNNQVTTTTSATSPGYFYRNLNNQIQSSTTQMYTYTWKSQSYIGSDATPTVTDTATLNASEFISSLFTIGTTSAVSIVDTSTAQSTATTNIKNKFSSGTDGSSTTVNSDLTVLAEISGTSTNKNEELVGNINTFLGESPVYGDYGEDYTPDFFAKKLLSFFGGVDADDVPQGTTATDTPPASTYYIETAGSNGKALIDGKEYDINSDNKVTVTGEDGVRIQYTFEAGMAGKGGVAFAKNDMQEVSVTYEQLANGYSFNDLVSSINSLGLNVRATYDSLQDRFSIYNKESGAENQINISFNALTTTDTNLDAATNRTVEFFNNLNLRQYTSEGIDTDSGNGADLTDFDYNFDVNKVSTLSGQNAIVKIDGIDYNDLQKNNLTVGGVTYNFNAVTNNNIDSATNTITSSGDVSKVIVNVSQDTENIVAKVKSFVEDYNAIMKKLYEWYDEKPNDNYKPLTASQKDGMKDEQIEKWEEKAKAGLLYHDKTLYSIISEMRAVISDRVEGVTGKYNNIFALGISTTGTKGQLVLDEEKLNAALAADADSVYNIFAKLDKGETQYLVTRNGKEIWTANKQAGDAPVKKDGKEVTKVVERSSYNGIAQRLSAILNTGMKNLRTVAGSTEDISEDSDLNNLLRELQTKMSNFQTMMKAFETALYKKYDAMESSLALLGAQLNYVTGAFQ